MNTFVIAEAGINHNGDVEIAKRLVEEAFSVGASAIKFQSFTADSLLSQDVDLKHVEGGSLKALFNKVSLSYDDHILIKEHCDKVGIEFLSTPFDFEMVDMLDELGVRMFKIASCDIDNLPFISYIAGKGKPVIISSGAATIKETKYAFDTLLQTLRTNGIFVLHCVSNYPTKLEDANLERMIAIRSSLPTQNVGFSDHTQGIIASTAAVALGAKVIERHFTLDKGMDGPDHALSSDPREFRQLIENIKGVEKCTSKRFDYISDEERNIKPLIRRSIVANRNIEEGEVINTSMISFKRPGTGLSPTQLGLILGKAANRLIIMNDQILEQDVF